MKLRLAMLVVPAMLAATALSPTAGATVAHIRAWEFAFGPELSSASLLPDFRIGVEFRNIGALRHQATSVASGLNPEGFCINTPPMEPGRGAGVRLPPTCYGQAIEYFCAFHPFMRGSLLVRLV